MTQYPMLFDEQRAGLMPPGNAPEVRPVCPWCAGRLIADGCDAIRCLDCNTEFYNSEVRR